MVLKEIFVQMVNDFCKLGLKFLNFFLFRLFSTYSSDKLKVQNVKHSDNAIKMCWNSVRCHSSVKRICVWERNANLTLLFYQMHFKLPYISVIYLFCIQFIFVKINHLYCATLNIIDLKMGNIFNGCETRTPIRQWLTE